MRRYAFRACLALGVAMATIAGAEEPDLESLREAIEQSRQRVGAYERETRGLFAAIEAVDQAIAALRVEVERADAAAREAASALARAERASRDLGARLETTRAALSRRAVALYKEGMLGPVKLVFAEGTLRDRVARVQALQLLADHDALLLERFREEEAALMASRRVAAEAAVARDESAAQLASRTAELEHERAAKRTLLARVREDRARERELLNELEAAARALERTLAQARETPAPAGPALPGLAGFAGRLEPPVSGRLLRGFGRVLDAEYRTATYRKGIDLAVSVGEPVYAVAPGEVRFSGWLGGYGRMVILDHGDGYFTVSGHLDRSLVEVGQRVSAGEPVGEAGETGSLSGPRLYFEIRRGAEALDPGRWLVTTPSG